MLLVGREKRIKRKKNIVISMRATHLTDSLLSAWFLLTGGTRFKLTLTFVREVAAEKWLPFGKGRSGQRTVQWKMHCVKCYPHVQKKNKKRTNADQGTNGPALVQGPELRGSGAHINHRLTANVK